MPSCRTSSLRLRLRQFWPLRLVGCRDRPIRAAATAAIIAAIAIAAIPIPAIAVTVAIAVTIAAAGVEPGDDGADERGARKLQPLDCGANEPRSHLTGADDKNCRCNGARQQRRIRQPHDRRTIDHDQIEHFQSDRKQRQQPRTAEQISGIGRQRTGSQKGKIVEIGLLQKLRRRGSPGQIIAQPTGIVEIELGVQRGFTQIRIDKENLETDIRKMPRQRQAGRGFPFRRPRTGYQHRFRQASFG